MNEAEDVPHAKGAVICCSLCRAMTRVKHPRYFHLVTWGTGWPYLSTNLCNVHSPPSLPSPYRVSQRFASSMYSESAALTSSEFMENLPYSIRESPFSSFTIRPVWRRYRISHKRQQETWILVQLPFETGHFTKSEGCAHPSLLVTCDGVFLQSPFKSILVRCHHHSMNENCNMQYTCRKKITELRAGGFRVHMCNNHTCAKQRGDALTSPGDTNPGGMPATGFYHQGERHWLSKRYRVQS